MAEALFQLKRYEEALSTYESCTKENIHDPNLYVKMGNVLVRLKRYQPALNAYEQALSLGAQSGEFYTLIGNVLCLLDRWQEALDVFDQALRLLPSYSKVERAEAHRGKQSAFESLAKQEDERAAALEPSYSLDDEEFP
jgi:tetratricopeptide (TPR) repeat protein